MPRLRHCLLTLAASALLWNATIGGQAAETAAPPKTPAEIERLIKQLGSDKFDQREAASKALEAMGDSAWEALHAAVGRNNDPEVTKALRNCSMH